MRTLIVGMPFSQWQPVSASPTPRSANLSTVAMKCRAWATAVARAVSSPVTRHASSSAQIVYLRPQRFQFVLHSSRSRSAPVRTQFVADE